MVEIKLYDGDLEKAHELDACYDLRAKEPAVLKPKSTTVVELNLRCMIPEGYFGKLFDRSSMAAKGLFLGGGVIDSGYIGWVKAVIYNSTDDEYHIEVEDRVCQLAILPVVEAKIRMAKLSDQVSSKRGTKGFGSTGR